MINRSVICKAAAVAAAFVTAAATVYTSVFAGEPFTGRPDEYYIWLHDEAVENDTAMMKSCNVHYDFVTTGKKKVTTYERRMTFTGVDAIWFGDPVVKSCPACRMAAESSDLYTVRIFLEDDNGTELVSRSGVRLGADDLNRTGIDFETLSVPLRVGIELTQKPGSLCSSCSTHLGDNITVDGVYCHRTVLVVDTPPADTSAGIGEDACFNISLSRYVMTHQPDPRSSYKWVVSADGGEWTKLSDGKGSYGEIYEGTNTPNLKIRNVSSELNGRRFACTLYGTYGKKLYSSSATLTVTGAGGSSPGPVPTPDPGSVTPAPGPGPGGATTPTPIVPKEGKDDEYKPSSSSSSYVAPSPSPGHKPSSSSSSSSSKKNTDDNDPYRGDINTPPIPGTGDNVPAVPTPEGGSPSKSSSSKNGTSSKGAPKGGSSGRSSSSAGGSSTYVSRRPNSSTFMKNGILYIVDDDGTGSVGADRGTGGDSAADEVTVESSSAYSAADLASDMDLTEQEMQKGFFDTPYGYAVIILSSLVLLLLLLFFLFFGVIVFGEVEEHDEVFELCAVRIVLRCEGNWCIKLSDLFDDNAVVRLRIGLLFAVMFDGWDLVGMTKGVYEGTVTGRIGQNMEMHRRDVRRSV